MIIEIRTIPDIDSNVLSVKLQFCERFNTVRLVRCLIFLTPVSVNPPPQISRDWRFFKSA
uniref:Uncharacterized protein MANES_14G119400 n=1 Tax=Rhizophora mucronata TaxID=61149 RepID=A0A2P2L7Y6_RHIMU